jgi:hypothetical protein
LQHGIPLSLDPPRIVTVAVLTDDPAALVLYNELGLFVAGKLTTSRDRVRLPVV